MADFNYGVHSEVGKLRKVMVCAPGRAHQCLTPTDCEALLFDDVLWVDAGSHAMLGSLFVVTSVLGLFISNTATAVLMAPVALAIADHLQASPYPFAMIVALASSKAFMTPISSPVNALVVAPGNYTFGDFTRIGVSFSVIVAVVSVILVPWLLPLYPP